MLCPQLKELSLSSTASPHRPSHHLSGAAVHRSTLARTARGNAVLQRWRAERPEKSGVPENNIPGPWRTPQVSTQQTTQPIRLTPSDHSGCNPEPSVLSPRPAVDSQRWCKAWVHKQWNWESATNIYSCILTLQKSNPSDIIYNADSDLSTNIYCKISVNNDMRTNTVLIDAIHNDCSNTW